MELSYIAYAGLAYILFVVGKAAYKSYKGTDRTHVCRNCGETIAPRSVEPGSGLIEIVLWCLMVVPGLIYSLWRMSSKRLVCPVCQALHPVPLTSPTGKALASR